MFAPNSARPTPAQLAAAQARVDAAKALAAAAQAQADFLAMQASASASEEAPKEAPKVSKRFEPRPTPPTQSCRRAPTQERSGDSDPLYAVKALLRWIRYPTVPFEYMEEKYNLHPSVKDDLRTFLVKHSLYFTIGNDERGVECVSITSAGHALKAQHSTPPHTPQRGPRTADFSPVVPAAKASHPPTIPHTPQRRGPYKAAAAAAAPVAVAEAPFEFSVDGLLEHFRSMLSDRPDGSTLKWAVACNINHLPVEWRKSGLKDFLLANMETFSSLVEFPKPKAAAASAAAAPAAAAAAAPAAAAAASAPRRAIPATAASWAADEESEDEEEA